jgi:DNA anti-recombination protein RmuC
MLFAAEEITSGVLSGGAGWVGAGLLGLVLFWLLFRHLPEKDKQMANFVEKKDDMLKHVANSFSERIKGVADQHTTTVKELNAAHKEALDRVVKHCEQEMNMVGQSLHREFDQLSGTVRELASAVGTLKNQRKGG